MEYMTAKEAGELWGITTRRVQALCENEQIPNATRLGKVWAIPKGTPKPLDGRTKIAKKQKEGVELRKSNRQLTGGKKK